MNLLQIITDRTVLLGALSYTLSLTDIDIIIKILIGVITIVYIGYKALNEKKKYDEK